MTARRFSSADVIADYFLPADSSDGEMPTAAEEDAGAAGAGHPRSGSGLRASFVRVEVPPATAADVPMVGGSGGPDGEAASAASALAHASVAPTLSSPSEGGSLTSSWVAVSAGDGSASSPAAGAVAERLRAAAAGDAPFHLEPPPDLVARARRIKISRAEYEALEADARRLDDDERRRNRAAALRADGM
jgi:hypothetical protein